MRRLFKLYLVFIQNSLAREVEFRANFFAKLLQGTIWIVFFLMLVIVVFSKTNMVAGYNKNEMYVLMGTAYLLSAVFNMIFGFNLQEIPTSVRMGTLDYVLVKPVDSQFYVSMRKLSFDSLGTSLFALGLVAYGCAQVGIVPSLWQILSYIISVTCAIIIFYSFEFILMTTAIWLVRVENLWVLGETVSMVVRWPINIFDAKMQFVFFYIIPLAFIATVPAKALLGMGSNSLPYLALGIVWALGFFTASRLFWKFALKYYSSASS
jgi:ABC-2 type transport system permease protein